MTGSGDLENPTVGGALLPAAARRRPESAEHRPDPFRPGTAAGLRVGPDDDPDRFQLLGEGLTGGEGVTWKAHYVGGLHAPLSVAIKWLRPPPGAPDDWPTAVDRRRWQDQLALLGHLQAERLVRVHGVFAGAPPHRLGQAAPAQDCAYLQMEWVDGPTLAQLVAHTAASPQTLRQRMGHVAEVGEALASLLSLSRSAGNPSLHRDVKPGNCIVHQERGTVLIDISNLRLVDGGVDQLAMYTPAYTAPEVLLAPHRPREASSDVYSLGALAAFCLLGESPPAADVPGTPDQLAARLHAAAVLARAADPQSLSGLVMRALDPDPHRRPADVVTWGRHLLTATGDPVTGAGSAPVPVGGSATAPQHGAGGGRRRRGRQGLRGALIGLGITTGLVAAVVATLVLSPRIRAIAADDPVAPASQPTPAAIRSQPPVTPSGSTLPTPTSSTPGTGTGSSAPVPPSTGAVAVSSPPGSSSPSTPPVVVPSSAPPTRPAKASGRISTPVERAAVQLCAPFAGTAALPAGKTLLLAMKNLDNHDPHRYVTLVFGFASPPARWSWRGVQYFGSDDQSAGQAFQVELMAVDLAKANAAISEQQKDALVAGGTVLDTVHLDRIPGGSPDDCPTA